MTRPESKFPTIKDVHSVMAELIDEGLGDLPVQVLVAPDTTIQALARHAGATDDSKPALMLEFDGKDGRIGVMVMSTERLEQTPQRRERVQ